MTNDPTVTRNEDGDYFAELGPIKLHAQRAWPSAECTVFCVFEGPIRVATINFSHGPNPDEEAIATEMAKLVGGLAHIRDRAKKKEEQ